MTSLMSPVISSRLTVIKVCEPKPTSEGKTQFKRRDSVEHATFGVGTVIESNIIGGEEEVTVAFPGVGIKKLAASMANLKKL